MESHDYSHPHTLISTGGHASQRIYLSPGVDVVKLELTLAWSQFQGMRITLSDGTVKGELNARHKTDVLILGMKKHSLLLLHPCRICRLWMSPC